MHDERNTHHKKPSTPSIAWLCIGFLVLCIITWGGVGIQRGLETIRQGTVIESRLQRAELAIEHLDITAALQEISHVRSNITEVESTVQFFGFLEYVPFIGSDYASMRELIAVFSEVLRVSERMISLAIPLTDLERAKKHLFLKNISEGQPEITGSVATLQLLKRRLEIIPSSNIRVLEKIRGDMLSKLDILSKRIDEILPVLAVLPQALGLGGEKTYLLLFQNNNEVRATGGFIGTYGVVTVKNGEITRLFTDNVYNLDRKAEKTLRITPPKPFLDFFPKKLRYWFLRDSNWSPDFPTAARQAEFFYEREGGTERIDGVIALTPDVIVSLLSIVGPIEIDGVLYSSDTFVKDLQYQVEIGYSEQGIPESQRKDVIGRLTSTILQRLTQLPSAQWKNIVATIQEQLQQKQILAYFHQGELQNFIANANWDGRIRSSDGDFLMVVDSNMASLKTDAVMEKHITYSVQEYPDGHLQGTVLLTYKNTGSFTWFSTRYKDWVRILVPKDSIILNSEGAMKKELSDEIGPIEISSEGDKVSIGAFIVVEPQQTKTLKVEYRLPEKISAQVKSGVYTLLVQKQSGVSNQKLDLNLNFSKPVKRYISEPPHASMHLKKDREFRMEF
ncbi:MAG: DUF4012 domain-containing protein [bacterium]|nr:DUF4012 domain-containing protein [bacterium]